MSQCPSLPNLYLKKPTETEQLAQEDYNDNMDTIDQSFNDHLSDNQAHGMNSLAAAMTNHINDLSAHGETFSLYKLNKDPSGVFTELQWKRPDGTLAKRMVLSNGIPPYYTSKTVTYYQDDGITVKDTKEYALTYDQDHDLISEVLQ